MINKLREMGESWGGQLLPYDGKIWAADPRIVLNQNYNVGHVCINRNSKIVYYDPTLERNVDYILAVIHCMGKVFACREPFREQDPRCFIAWEYQTAQCIGISEEDWWANQDWETENDVPLKSLTHEERKTFLLEMTQLGIQYGNLSPVCVR